MKFISPLHVPVGKKRFTLNLNNYRNAHFHVLNRAKKTYREIMLNQTRNVKPFSDQVRIEYTLYPKTGNRVDIANVISIHAKFFCDVLVYSGLIQDDEYRFVIGSSEKFGHVDNINPRVEIEVINAR